MFNLAGNGKYIILIVVIIALVAGMMFYVKNCVRTEIDEIRTVSKKKRLILMKRQQEMQMQRMREEQMRQKQMEEAQAVEQDAESYIDPVDKQEDIGAFNMNEMDNKALGF